MDAFSPDALTRAVIDRMAGCADPRLREVMASVVRHLHAVVQEVRPTEAEWEAAIRFLTATGQACDDRRQEFILLSDTLGVPMMVDALNHGGDGDAATESTVLGPFYVAGAPELEMGADIARQPGDGRPLEMSGRVLGADGRPVAGAIVDVWQTAANGLYDVQDPEQPPYNLRGRFRTGADGRYRFRTIRPVSYPVPTDGPVGGMLQALGRHAWRPAHLHFMIAAPGHARLVTHLFVKGDPYLGSDAVFGVKDSLVVDCDLPSEAPGVAAAHYDFVLRPA